MLINRVVLSAVIVGLATPALAHTGVGPTNSFMAGLQHPVFGLDHLLAIVAVGLWATFAEPKHLWVAPAGFLCGMLLGGAAGMTGLMLPGVESAIVLSVVVFGVLGLFAAKVPPVLAFIGAALFAGAHGIAHGAEMPAGGGALSYGLGFLLATSALLAAGVAIGQAAKHFEAGRIGQAAGAALAAAGLVLMVG